MEDINNEDIAALLEEAEEEDDDDDEESEEELEPPIEADPPAPAQAPAAPAQAAGSAPTTDADGDQKMPPADGEAEAKKPEEAEKAEDVDSELERDLAGGMDEAVVSEVQKSATMAAQQSAAAGEEEMEDDDDDDDDESEEEEMAMDSEPEEGAAAAAPQGKEEGLQSAAAAMGSGKGTPQKELKQAVAAEEAPKAAAPAAPEPAAPAAEPKPSKADEIAAEKKALLEKQAALQASLAPLPEGEAFAAIRAVIHTQLEAVAKEIEAADAQLVAAQAEEAAAAAASKAAAAAAAASKAAAAVEAAKAAAEAKQDGAAKAAAPVAPAGKEAGSGKMDVDLVSGQTAPSPKKTPAPSPQKKPEPSPQKPDAAGLDEEMQQMMMDDDEGEEEELDSELERDLAGDMDPELFAELAASDPTAKKDGAAKVAKAKKETAASSGAGTSTSSSAKPAAATASPAATDNAKTVSSTAAAPKDEKPATKVPSLYADRIKASPKVASKSVVPKASSIVAKPDSMPAKPPNALSLHIREQEASGKVGNRASFAALSQDELKRLNSAVQELQKKYAENMAAFLQTKDGKEYQKKLDSANQKTKLARAKEKLKAAQPTKPLSAFGLFTQACKGQTGCGLPTVRWAKLTEKEKQFWEEEHKKAMAEYQKAMAAFEKSAEYKAFEKAKNATGGKNKAPPSKEEGAAKRQRLPTPFILYLKDMAVHKMDRAELSKGWTDLGPEGQQKYHDRYKAMQEQLQNAPSQPSEGKRRQKDAASPKQPPKAPPPEPPVRPKSAKMLFLDGRRKEIIKEEGSSVAPGELARRLIKDWESLIPEQKKAWEDREKALMATYNQEMERYKQLTAAPAQQPAGRASAGGKRPNPEMGQGDDQGSDSSSSSSSSSD